jgi:anti-anti-sigma regulatory factor
VIKFEVDQPRNRLVIRYRGSVVPKETEDGLEEIRSGIAQLRSPFHLLVDFTGLERMDLGCARFIEKAMDVCNEKGASMVVRVIPDPHRDIGMTIMSIFHYRGDTQIFSCETLAQAEQLLSS